MKLLLCILLLSISMFSQAQKYDPTKINKKAVALFEQGRDRANEGNLPLAAGLLKKALETDASYLDAYLALATVYGKLRSYSLSSEYYEKAFQKDADYSLPFKDGYAIGLAAQGRFAEALNAINEVLSKQPPRNENSLKNLQRRQQSYEFAVEFERTRNKSDYVFTPINAGPNINTTEAEYFPSLTIDSQQLIFTRKINNINEDFFVSDNSDKGWIKANAAKGNVNTNMNEGAQNISVDGQTLVFTACNRPDGMGSCDIYISYLTNGEWGEATNMGRAVNSEQWDSQPCLSPDKTDLYFASSRAGGYGGTDIYVSHKQSNGRWGAPVNLGPRVNTPGDEQCPFMHADNQTFYFTSNYWPGYGDDDLFFTRKSNTGLWSAPKNLGYPINTINKEGALFITADGNTAYYSSDKSDSRGQLDIYYFTMPLDIRPIKTKWIKGHVFDALTRQPLQSSIELIDIVNKQLINYVQTDPNGNYTLTLPIGKQYAFNVNRKGYLFYSDNFSLQNVITDSTTKDIPLQPIELNATVVLHNIFFNSNKYDLDPASQIELDKLVQLLNENPTLRIEIDGYTDNVGKQSDNLILSANRAKSVVTYLINKKIIPQRLTYKGYGAINPRADNSSDKGKALNRRTEMKVIMK